MEQDEDSVGGGGADTGGAGVGVTADADLNADVGGAVIPRPVVAVHLQADAGGRLVRQDADVDGHGGAGRVDAVLGPCADLLFGEVGGEVGDQAAVRVHSAPLICWPMIFSMAPRSDTVALSRYLAWPSLWL